MKQAVDHDQRIFVLLHGKGTKRLMAHLTEKRLQRRCKKSKTIESGRNMYDRLIRLLLEYNYFNKVPASNHMLYELMTDNEIIEDAMIPLCKALNISIELGTPLFCLIIGWIASELELSDTDLVDVMTCYTLAPTDEGQMAHIIRLLVQTVTDNAVRRVHSKGPTEEYDSDLQFLLHNGTPSSIYGRLKLLLDCGNMFYGDRVEFIVVNTLVMELPRLSRSRQIVFTQVIRHIAEVIAGIGSPVSIFKKIKCDSTLFKLLLDGVENSGVSELAYDDTDLLRVLGQLTGKFDLRILTRLLSHDTRSYVGDANDFRQSRDMVGALYAMRKRDIKFDFPTTFNFADGNMGTLLLDKMPV